ncbi:ABC transporter ATP-binding protein [Zafaria sp. Z1313]|uniref:ABC transporter ATP-binding protein n=1 Tax=unclassified Zafaria TaxID=2828765 RepID=UPI002E78DED5|nr:ATP-binding cassette domain-containing protein [Zafaria sp. J156]MEE1621660.1 ATP-binding cassette domain-containing protein [Zafaria sp. J156]
MTTRTRRGAPDSAPPFLEVEGLTVGYMPGVPVLRDLTFTAALPLVHLRGTNGSGKSTLLEVVAGILEPWSGTVRVQGFPPPSDAARAARRVVRADPALIPALSVRAQAELMSQSLGLPGEALFERLASHRLGSWLDAPAGELSTGNLRKAWFVLATASPASLMILDEPFNGLDDSGVVRVVEEIDGWIAEGRRVLVVAHDLPDGLVPHERIELPAWRHAAGRMGGRP